MSRKALHNSRGIASIGCNKTNPKKFLHLRNLWRVTHLIPHFSDTYYCSWSGQYENDKFFNLKWPITSDIEPVPGDVIEPVPGDVYTQTVRLVEAYNPIEIETVFPFAFTRVIAKKRF